MPTKKANVSGISSNLSKSISKDIAIEEKETMLPLSKRRIGISVSDSEEYHELGFSEIHQKDITVEATRFLLANGAHLVYGGDLRNGGYTYAFSELAFQYRRREKSSTMLYTNYFGWPIHLNLKHSDEATLKRNRVKVAKVEAPKEVPPKLRNKKIKPDTRENKYYWAMSMSKMRKEMIANCDGRILIGGKLSSYKGFLPGIIEEAYMAIEQNQPIYLIGAFGGASSILIRAIKGENVNELEREVMEWYPELEDLHKVASENGQVIPSIKFILEKFHKMGLGGLSKINKLSKEQNEILFQTRHLNEMILYVLLGLKKSLGERK